MKSREAVVLRIMELIEDQDITVNYLSTISAVPPTTLKNIIHGYTVNPGIVTIKKLCDGLQSGRKRKNRSTSCDFSMADRIMKN